MTQLTRSDVVAALGQVDDVTVADIIATGASHPELAEALAWIANDEPLVNAGRSLASGRTARLVGDPGVAPGGGGIPARERHAVIVPAVAAGERRTITGTRSPPRA